MILDILFPGTRVMVFDHRLYDNDKTTPLAITMQPATVVRWYGKRTKYISYIEDDYGESFIDEVRDWIYPTLVDVEFDYRPGEISCQHFADYLSAPKE